MRFLLHRVRLRSIALAACETGLIMAAVAAAAYARLGYEDAFELFLNEGGVLKTLLVVAVAQVSLYYADLYDVRVIADRRELFTRLIQALATTCFALAAIYFWFPSTMLGRGVFLIAAVLVATVAVLWRIVFEWLSGQMGPRERLLLVGTGQASVDLARELYSRRHELGVEIVGFIDPDPTKIGTPLLNPGIIGSIDDIPSIVKQKFVDRVVVSLADARGTLPVERLLDMKLRGVSFDHLASVYEEYTGKIAVENLRPSWFIFSDGFRKTRFLSASKRLLDIVCATLLLIPTLPLMLLVALAVKWTSKGPALYHQQRVGLNGRVFTVHKFRSMKLDAEAATGPVWASKSGDPRVTPIGGILRRTRIDELPQLWNVLKGDMSFVGPRPERPEFVAELTENIRFYGQRHVVRPGLTGWAQVCYTYGATTEDALQKLQFDLYYIKNLSIALDIYIIVETVKTVVLRKGASPMAITNAMTVDVEDYFHVSVFEGVVPRSQWTSMESRVEANTGRLLDLFDEHAVKGTFFVLGWVAERHPSLVRAIVQRGHELASHGYGHRLIYNQTPDDFREDVRRAKGLLEDAGGIEVHGYRAPSFSVTTRSMWALDVLLEERYSYDASIFPIRHDRYGIPDAPRWPHHVSRAGGKIYEIPGTTVRMGRTNLPVAGGGYLRILPYSWTRWGIKRVNEHEQQPAIFYLHPWEVDPAQPRLPASALGRFRHYRNLHKTEDRLRALMRDFRFGPLNTVLSGCVS